MANICILRENFIIHYVSTSCQLVTSSFFSLSAKGSSHPHKNRKLNKEQKRKKKTEEILLETECRH